LLNASEGCPHPTQLRATLTGCWLPSIGSTMAGGGKREKEEKKKEKI